MRWREEGGGDGGKEGRNEVPIPLWLGTVSGGMMNSDSTRR